MGFKARGKEGSGVILLVVILMGALLSVGLLTWEKGLGEVYTRAPKGIIPDAETLESIISTSEKPVAVEFSSETCPACAKMEPYWAELVEKSERLPADFYFIYFSSETSEAFNKYGVTETPTYILFVDGRPVARKVGTFTGENITNSMYLWVVASLGMEEISDPEKLALAGLTIFNEKCSSCHGRIESLDEVSRWLESRAEDDALATLLRKAIEKEVLPRDLYGGFGGLRDAVASMRKYVSLSTYEVERAAYLIDYIASKVMGREAPEIPKVKISPEAIIGSGEARNVEENPYVPLALSVPAYIVAFIAGLITAFSPCVFPIFLTNLTVMVSSGRRFSVGRCIVCSVAAAIGVLIIGALFVLASGFLSSLQSILIPIVAILIMAVGLAGLLGSPAGLRSTITSKRGGITGFCALYGLLAIQCNIFIIIGIMLLIVGVGSSLLAAGVLTSFAAGVAIPIGVVMYLAGRLGGALNSLASKGEIIERAGSTALFIIGLYLLLTQYVIL